MKKWFKVVGSLVVAALLTALVAGAVLAQGPVGDSDGFGQGRGAGYGFVDEDGDGVNDRYGSNPEFVDEDGDGICDIHGVAPGDGEAQGYGRFRSDDDAQRTPMAGGGGFGHRALGR